LTAPGIASAPSGAYHPGVLTESQRAMVWEEWLSAEMRGSYFADLCGVYNRRQRWSNFGTLVLSSGAAYGMVATWMPNWVPAAMTLVAAAISAYLLVSQNIKHAMECADLSFRWNKLAHQYRDIWNDQEAPDAVEKLARANETNAEASKAGAAFSYSPRRMSKWQDLVVANRTPRAA
jgi:hypothetical protein